MNIKLKLIATLLFALSLTGCDALNVATDLGIVAHDVVASEAYYEEGDEGCEENCSVLSEGELDKGADRLLATMTMSDLNLYGNMVAGVKVKCSVAIEPGNEVKYPSCVKDVLSALQNQVRRSRQPFSDIINVPYMERSIEYITLERDLALYYSGANKESDKDVAKMQRKVEIYEHLATFQWDIAEGITKR